MVAQIFVDNSIGDAYMRPLPPVRSLSKVETRSFWYCALIHAFVIIWINLVAVLRQNADNFGVGVADFIEVFARLFVRTEE
ncbi:hypothetical protein KAH81_02650 [bacterium]|nr:hypothetical protein [bacterium]